MLTFKEFVLQESLNFKDPIERDLFKRLQKEFDPARYKELFQKYSTGKYRLGKGAGRIYYPMTNIESSKTKEQIIKILTSQKYKIIDYVKGEVRSPKGKKISLITALNTLELSSFIREYEEDVEKLKNKKSTNQSYSVVISRLLADIAGMSLGRRWSETSCMNIHKYNGQYANDYLPAEIKQGSLVAYLIRTDDVNIKDPLCRVTIKPYIGYDEKDILFLPATKIYHDPEDEEGFKNKEAFGLSVLEWTSSVNASSQLEGVFKLKPGVYVGDEVQPILNIGKPGSKFSELLKNLEQQNPIDILRDYVKENKPLEKELLIITSMVPQVVFELVLEDVIKNIEVIKYLLFNEEDLYYEEEDQRKVFEKYKDNFNKEFVNKLIRRNRFFMTERLSSYFEEMLTADTLDFLISNPVYISMFTPAMIKKVHPFNLVIAANTDSRFFKLLVDKGYKPTEEEFFEIIKGNEYDIDIFIEIYNKPVSVESLEKLFISRQLPHYDNYDDLITILEQNTKFKLSDELIIKKLLSFKYTNNDGKEAPFIMYLVKHKDLKNSKLLDKIKSLNNKNINNALEELDVI